MEKVENSAKGRDELEEKEEKEEAEEEKEEEGGGTKARKEEDKNEALALSVLLCVPRST